MDYDAGRFWFDVAQLILTSLIGVYVYFSNRHRVTNSRIGALEKDVDTRLDDHANRITKMEATIDKAPTHDDLSKLYERLNSISGKLESVNGQVGGITRNVDLISQHLLNGGK